MSKYVYLFGALFSLLVWSVVYGRVDKESRKEMVLSGLVIIPIALYFEVFFWTKDWWLPSTITGTLIGIEDIIYAFATPGLFVAGPLALFGKRISIEKTKEWNTIGTVILSVLCVVLFTILFYVFHIHSFYGSLVSVVVPAFIIFVLRKDLIPFSLISAALFFIVPPIMYWTVGIFEPGFIQDIWFTEHLSGIVFLSTPLEDAIWYTTSAMFVSIIYKYWRRGKVSYHF